MVGGIVAALLDPNRPVTLSAALASQFAEAVAGSSAVPSAVCGNALTDLSLAVGWDALNGAVVSGLFGALPFPNLPSLSLPRPCVDEKQWQHHVVVSIARRGPPPYSRTL